jgi:hypothetical protein
LPARSIATDGLCWFDVVYVLTANSGPRRAPVKSKTCPKTPPPSPSWPLDSQTTTKSPAGSMAKLGENCALVVYVFTRNSAPSFAPAASNRCP